MATTIGTVTINRNPSIESSWYNDRMNQYTVVSADGTRTTYDNGPTILKGVLVLKLVAKSEGDSLRTYLTGTAAYCQNSFSITPTTNTDLGSGAGVAVTSAYYDGGNTLDGVFQLSPNGTMYTITFPYWKKVT